MSYIPDCRTDEAYNEKYLNKEDKTFVYGFDYCAEQAVDSFFYNLDVYFEDDDKLMELLQAELPEDEKQENATTYADLLKNKMLEWIEGERDELITAMINDMDDDEYEEIKAQVDGEDK